MTAIEKLVTQAHGYRKVLTLAAYVILIAFSHQAAFWLRFEGVVPQEQAPLQFTLLPLLVCVRLAVFMAFRLHEGVWRYASLRDAQDIVIGVGSSTFLFFVIVQLLAGITLYPRSVFIIDSFLLIGLLGSVRVARRVYGASTPRSSGRPVLVYGAGDAGEMIVRDMLQNPGYNARPIGFIDDDRRKVNHRIHGLPVFGSRSELGAILTRTRAEEILIAIPSAPPKVLRDILRQLTNFKVRISTLPRLSAIVGQQIGVQQIRELKLEDLLTRPQVTFDHAPLRQMVEDRCILVTGAGGSIGSEICRQTARLRPRLLIILDRYENGLFEIQSELAKEHPDIELRPVIADVTDARRVDQVFAEGRPDVVFHAAAHKHVPLMEGNPCEAVKNNVSGTRIVAEGAYRFGVDRFVLISTDKAVNPTSVMGFTKRVAELVIEELNGRCGTRFAAVRFGNVLGSNGSVVPTFLGQIANGGPVTVTHPEMKRFFMLIPEAVQLVLHAGALADQATLFVLEMGEQVKVVDMARDLIRLAGYIPDKDIDVEFTGIRPGEKLFEELLGEGEVAEPSSIAKILRVRTVASPRP
ncbi:MAG: nucleoside-diphosphate sugar epimerase/dehydratase, partial [Vicinamibacterales bacterium]